MGWILLPLAAATASLAAQAPPGWQVSEESQVSLDTSVVHTGRGSGHLRGRSAEDFVTLRQSLSPDSLRGHRVRFSGYVRSNLSAGIAGLWMRVDGAGLSERLAFDNMSTRPIKGVTPWTRYEIVLDVPSESSTIILGVLMVGQGDVWLDDVVVEVVGREVPSTNMLAAVADDHVHSDAELTEPAKERIRAARRAAPLRLRNLNFEERTQARTSVGWVDTECR
jgi:hypothetical protein